jgi:Spy/CpxP family protein refolding chaperone
MHMLTRLGYLAVATFIFFQFGVASADAQQRQGRTIDLNAAIQQFATDATQAQQLTAAVATVDAHKDQPGYLWHVAAAVTPILTDAQRQQLISHAQTARSERVQNIQRVPRTRSVQGERRMFGANLDLTDAQRDAIRAAREQHRGDRAAMRAQLERILTPEQRAQMSDRAWAGRRGDATQRSRGEAAQHRRGQRAADGRRATDGTRPGLAQNAENRGVAQRKAMVDALNLTADQQQAMAQAVEQNRAAMRENREQLRQAEPAQRRQMLEQMRGQQNDFRVTLNANQRQIMEVHNAIASLAMTHRVRGEGQRRGR